MHLRNIILVLFICFALKLEGNLWDTTGMYDSCYIDRFASSNQRYLRLSSMLLDTEKVILLLLFGVLAYLTPNTIAKSLFVFIWYILSNVIIMELKIIFGDTTCGGGKPNSISGHYSFFGFYIFTLPTLLDALPYLIKANRYFSLSSIGELFKKSSISEILATSLYLAFSFIALIIVYGTWAYGFHSHSQILNGILFSTISHLICDQVIKRNKLDLMIKFIIGKVIFVALIFSMLIVSGKESSFNTSKIM